MKAHLLRVGLPALTLALAAPASSTAAVTVGSNLEGNPNVGLVCVAAQCTASQATLPATSTAPGGLVAPIDGIVVRWRIKVGASEVAPVALRITRPGDSSSRTGAGTGPTETPPANTTSTYEIRLPIRAGDGIGIDCCLTSDVYYAFANTTDSSFLVWNPPLQNDAAPRPNDDSFPYEVLVNVDIEPDCDNDGLGDETQDPQVLGTACPKAGRTLTLDASKGRVKKGKNVRFSGRIDAPQQEAACEPNQAVELQRKEKKAPETGFQTFEIVKTDEAGNFSDKEKVKKTYVYRAVVAESIVCLEGLSETEKVKVKRNKR